MSPSAQLTLEPLQEIIEDEMKTDQGTRVDQEQAEDGEEVFNPDKTSSVLSTGLKTINTKFEHECLDEAVRLLTAQPIHQSITELVPGHKYSIPGLPRSTFLVKQVLAMWLIMRSSVWDADMPGAQVADEMCL
jgi:hypothetical protein